MIRNILTRTLDSCSVCAPVARFSTSDPRPGCNNWLFTQYAERHILRPGPGNDSGSIPRFSRSTFSLCRSSHSFHRW
jgi:hypothetical protein